MYDNELKSEENKIWTKDKLEAQHVHNMFNNVMWRYD